MPSGRVRGIVAAVARGVAAAVLATGLAIALRALFPHAGTAETALVALAAVAGVIAVVLAVVRAVGSRSWRGLALLAAGLAVAFAVDAAIGAAVPASGTPATPASTAAGACATCPAAQQITGIGVRRNGGHTDVAVRLGARPVPGERLWLWFSTAPAVTVALVATAGVLRVAVGGPGLPGVALSGDLLGSTVLVRLTGPPVGPVAVTTASGDRAPRVGYLDGGGPVLPAAGSEAAAVAESIASAQAGIGALDPAQAALAVDLLAREQVTGTFTYDAVDPATPGALVIRLVSRYPAIRQDVFRGGASGAPLITVLRTAGATVDCTPSTPGPATCRPDDGRTLDPAGQVLGFERGPELHPVTVLEPRVIAGADATCFQIGGPAGGGPLVGTQCFSTDGALAFLHNDATGQQYTLRSRSSLADPALLAAA